jgi:hypothetical protein
MTPISPAAAMWASYPSVQTRTRSAVHSFARTRLGVAILGPWILRREERQRRQLASPELGRNPDP